MKNAVHLMAILLVSITSVYAAELPTEKEFTNSINMKFVRIEPGTFNMGLGDGKLPKELVVRPGLYSTGDYDEHPAHAVEITKPFYMGVTEVTNTQYEQFNRMHERLRGKKGFSIDHDEAVVFVSWHEAMAFCDWLSQVEGLPYRLPTEAEWEYACRAGTTTIFSTGDTLPEEFVKNPGESWYPSPVRGGGSREIVPLHVGKTSPNPWGLYDMHGNVEEWCYDWYGPYEDKVQKDPIKDPVGRVDGRFKVTRGGSHGTIPYYLRSSNRMGTIPDDKSFYIGLRVVLGESPAATPLPATSLEPYQKNVNQSIPPAVDQQPDEGKAYFRGPRNFVRIPEGSFGPLFSRHNHCPAIVECPNGDLLTTWYTTETENGREISIAASRLRYGTDVWQQASLFWNPPDRNVSAQALMSGEKNTIYHFNSLSTAATWGPLAVVMRTSIDNGVTWSKARPIIPEHEARHQVAESAFRTKEGYFVLPCDATPSGSGGTAVHISRDNGLTWEDAGGTLAGIHGGVSQLTDGRLIAFGRGDEIAGKVRSWMAARVIGDRSPLPRAMTMSISSDMGKSWTYQKSVFPSIGGGQRVAFMRLKEGPLLLASLAGRDDEGREVKPVMVTDASGKRRQVFGLFAALSYDDGKTWPVARLVTDDAEPHEVPTTNGRTKFIMSKTDAEPKGYLSVCQARNGMIHLISSWNHYAFNIKWIETPPPALTE
ncbi:MAG: SUMF1/EgtB/PvdO family nonheme iron enzyme [Planctomycetota bacterium]